MVKIMVKNITFEEAKRIYEEAQKRMAQTIKREKKWIAFTAIVAGIISWSALFGWGAVAYAGNTKVVKQELWRKDYSIKSEIKDSKPIHQFPKDVINLVTAWREIPKTVSNIGRKKGAIAGITLGPIKGTTTMVENISKGIWQSLNSDNDQKESHGLVFSYKF